MVGLQSASRARRWYGWEVTKLVGHVVWSRRRLEGGGGGMVVERVVQNMRIAVRRFRRAPGFTATAVLTIALGIGANVSIFSIVDSVLLEALPYDEPDELVAIWEWNLARDRANNVVNPGNFSAWRDGSESFASMTAISLAQPATVTAAGEPDEAMIQYAAPDFFSVLGVDAAEGRMPTADLTGVETPEVVLSDRYWRERFAGDPEVVGTTVFVNGTTGIVVGVLSSDYVVHGEGTDIWVSTRIDRGDQTNSGRWLMVIGRLADGATLQIADAELKSIAAALEEEFPDFNSGWTVNLESLKDEVVGEVREGLWMLLAAVGLLLLIACANVANLFLVRATERRKEMAVRTSLGASGRALGGQLVTESALVSGVGAIVGVAAAYLLTGRIAEQASGAFSLPRLESAAVDGGVLVFAAGLTAGTALFFGLLPAFEAVRSSPASTLGAEARGPSRQSGRVRDALVVLEVAVSVVLLSGAALLARSFTALLAVDDGIEAEHVLVGRVNLSGTTYGDAASRSAFFDELLSRIESSPGVAAAGGITFLPMDGLGAATSYWPDDRPPPAPEDRAAADIRNVTGDYFAAMGIEFLQGRDFDDRDHAEAPQTIVVNRAMADRYWPDGTALGQRLVINWVDEEPWEIVGVVEDVRTQGPQVEPREVVYINYARGAFFPWLHLTVRATSDPLRLTQRVRQEVQALDPSLPLGSVRVMDDIVGRAVARPRMTSLMMVLFAGLATLLSAVGLYGVLAYTVSRRVREIGVRMALGAEPGDVLRLVVRQGSRLVVAGLAGGFVVAIAGARLMRGLLYQIGPADPTSLVAAGVILTSVSVAACAVPAWRASRVAPMEALRPD